MKKVTFEDIKANEEIKTYIREADASLLALGYTEHSFAHVMRCADLAGRWLLQLGYSEEDAELARIAAYMHDIGNIVNRMDHAITGGILAAQLLRDMQMPIGDVAKVITAIGHHDESSAFPVNNLAAVLILADKTDVRRSRVRNAEHIKFDIHDRVNYAVKKAFTTLDSKLHTITLSLEIDIEISSVMDYFEIFMTRMILCRKAADYLGLSFKLVINGSALS